MAAAPAAVKVKKEDGTQSKKDNSIRGGMAGLFFSKYVSNLSDAELGGMPTGLHLLVLMVDTALLHHQLAMLAYQ